MHTWLRIGLLCLIATPAWAINYSKVSSGLDYAHVTVAKEPWSIHIVRSARSRHEFQVVTTLAGGTIEGLSPVSRQAKTIPAELGNPVAGVNGDFFVIKPGPYQGDPRGLQIQNGELISAPGPASFWVDPRGLHLEAIENTFRLEWPDGKTTSFGLNQAPLTNQPVLFTPVFGASTRATNFLEMILEPVNQTNWLPLKPNQILLARVRAIHPAGDSPLLENRAVLTFGPRMAARAALIQTGAVFKVSTKINADLGLVKSALGGGPLLIHHGQETAWPAPRVGSTNTAPRHPRTALGFNSRYFFLVEVDGRQKELSMGMTFAELARFMKDLGCTEAMNLDGGGSSTFWLEEKIMNSPSDKHERSVANAIFIVRRPETRTR